MSCTDTTIAGAVISAAPDDVICVDPGVYTGQIVVDGLHLRIEASDPGVVVNTGSGAEIVRVEGGGELELVGIDIDGNNLRRCVLVTDGGSSLLLDESDVSGCIQPIDGAAIFLDTGTSAQIEDSTLVGNGSGGNSGAALFATGASVDVLRTTVQGGRAASAGALRLIGTPTTLDEVVFDDNEASAGQGGAVWIDGAALTVLGGSFSSGFSSAEGGCIALDGSASLDVIGTTFDGCSADGDGGGIWHSGTGAVDVSFATFENGSADLNLSSNGEGGGLFVESATSVTIADTLFDANFAAVGGGLYVTGIANTDLLRSSFFLNVSNDDAGGAYLSSPGSSGLVANNVFELNVCDDDGGGLHVANGTATVRNNVFLDNDCPGGGHDGDGAHFEGGNTPFLNNVVGYHADEGVRKAGGNLVSDYNLWEANAGGDANGFSKGGNEQAGDPLFVDFSDNGAVDDVLIPDVGSPLIDNGDPNNALDDLDGSQSDIGAFGGPDAPNLDVDGDGSLRPLDCDDTDPDVFPGGTELPADGSDGDCDTFEDCYQDSDNDGFGSATIVPSPELDCLDVGISDNPDDCAPADPNRNPGEIEAVANGIDDDCDGFEDCYDDDDDDGFGSDLTSPDSDLNCTDDPFQSNVDGDCEDDAPAVHPGGAELPADGIDGDCDLEEDCYVDGDGDGHGSATILASTDFDCLSGGIADNPDDCDDGNPGLNPDATDIPVNMVDENCSGGDTCWVDTDGDTYGDPTQTIDGNDLDCGDLGEAATNNDCNNSNPAIHPDAVEVIANGVDEDCLLGDTCFRDNDGDGTAGSASTLTSTDLDCTDPDEFAFATDCNDNDPNQFPGNFEAPANGIDEDCDGVESCFDDNDGDDFGTVVQDSADLDCTDAGEAALGGDCDDGSATIHPGATEGIADVLDQDCDGSELCYADLDFDGFGQSSTVPSTSLTCSASGVSANDTDCNDGRATAHPGASEIVGDEIDESCDGVELCWRDVDGDGFGTPLSTVTNGDVDCDDVEESIFDDDCNDGDVGVNPDALEITNDGIDETCDGFELCFQDLDGDTFGRTTTTLSTALSCNGASVANDSTDCDDGASGTFPGAPEIPDDEEDQDCNGEDTVTCFQDDDQDGFGSDTILLASDGTCDLAVNEADTGDDCDDDDPTIHPFATEIRNDGIDQDCNNEDLIDCYEDLDDDGFGHFPPTIVPFSGDCGPEANMSDNAADCDDTDVLTYPGAFDICGDGIDTDCSGDFDDDGDGLDFAEEEVYGTDDCDTDSDDDLADDRAEVLAGTDPLDDDSDDDTLLDGEEFGGAVPVDTDGDGDPDPLDDDDDDDLVPTADEVGISGGDHDGDTVPNHLDDDDDDDLVPTAGEDVDGDGDPQDDNTDGDANANWLDDDDDDDGVPTASEVAIPGANPLAIDSDGDTVLDGVEFGTGGLPTDTDEDGAPDIVDPDDDNDTIGTLLEGTADGDGDTLPNYQDLDSDGDGKSDQIEFPLGDTDGDLVPDWLDSNDSDGEDGDVDHDGLVTRDEFALGSAPDDPDTDDDGVPDGTEVPVPAAPLDTDVDLILDLFDPDDDQDNVPTRDETGVLCADGTPSYTLSASTTDLLVTCPDGELLAALVFKDTDGDTIPNYVDPDDDGDGILTVDEDSNGNGDPFDDDHDGDAIPDFEDLFGEDGPLGDLDGDSLANTVEEEQGSDPYSDDTDGDGVLDPDELGDADSDGILDFEDDDDDGDGIPTLEEGQVDTDGDGIADYLDLDSDDDGITDRAEDPGDTDCDGLPERVDREQGTACEDGPVVGAGEVYVRQACGCDGTGGAGWLAFVAAGLAVRRRRDRPDPAAETSGRSGRPTAR